MFRLCENKIIDWLKNRNDALLITGARQVGKTYTIRKVLENNKKVYVEFDFRNNNEVLNVIKKENDVCKLVEYFNSYFEKSINKEKCIIFFNNIEIYPDLMTKIKFLVDEGTFKYILSGSLLGVEIKNIRSIPVGYYEELKMYPLNFYEFALALGVKEETLNYVETCFTKKEPVDSLIHNKMVNLLNTYLVTGGMPGVVKTFIETRNLNSVEQAQINIINQYKTDFVKYEEADKKLKILSIYENMPSQLNKQNLKFVYSRLNKELKFERYENSFLWLKDAGVAYPVYISSEVNSPLIMSKDKNTFKLFFNDVGLLTANFPFDVKLELIENKQDLIINKGALLENFVCEELKSNNLDVFYYKNKAIGELDFLVETDLNLNIIEVKSGKDFKIHKSLDNIMNNSKSNYKAIVLSYDNLEIENNILYIPLYMASLIKNKEPFDYIVNVDLKGI